MITLTVVIEPQPKTDPDERIEIKDLGSGFHRVVLHYGFMQGPNVPSELARCKEQGLDVDLDDATYYIGRQTLVPSEKLAGMASWRDRLFAFLARNATDATTFYQLPTERVVEMGFQVRI